MRKGVIAAVALVLLAVVVLALRRPEVSEPEGGASDQTAALVRPEAVTEAPAVVESADPAAEDGATMPSAKPASELAAVEPPPVPAAPVAEPAGAEEVPAGEDAAEGGETASAGPEAGTTAGAEETADRLAALPPAEPPAPTDTAGAAPEASDTSGPPPEDPEAPAFDLVRISPEGQVVVAGSARPGATVEVLVEGDVIGSAEADATGAFVAVLEAGASGEARQMVLRVARSATAADPAAATAAATGTAATGGAPRPDPAARTAADGEAADPTPPAVADDPLTPQPLARGAEPTASAEPPTTASGASAIPAEAAGEPGTAAGGSASGAAAAETLVATLDPAAGSADPGYAFSAPIIILPTASPGEAPVLVSPGSETVEVVQPARAEAVDGLALDRITYRAGGDVVAAGRGREASAVRAYADGRLVDEAEVARSGGWQATIPRTVAEAASLLRFDEVSAGGDVTGRLETPFDYAGEGAVQELRQRRIVVQRGNNLWRIAEQHYGEGIRYSVIYGANSELIRDPDLIYPDQVFTIPELVESE